MALVRVVIFLKLFFLLVAEGFLINDESMSYNISLGSNLTTDTNPSWVSPSGLFAFGFYQQDGGFAVGIWLTTKPEITVVWTANRDDPPLSSNSTIELTGDGHLLLFTTYGEQKPITGQSDSESATSASMFDSGNFVLYNHSEVIWQSFHYPCDTILGGQELVVWNQLVSSVSASQYSSSGRFVLKMQGDGNLAAYPQNNYVGTSDSYWTTGTYAGRADSLSLNRNGSLYMMKSGEAQMVLNPSTSSQSRKNETIVFRATLNPDGNFVLYSHRFTNPSGNSTGMMEWEALQDPCKATGICGVNSYCYTTAGKAECRCFPGFLFFNDSRDGNFLGCYRNFADEEACSQRGLQLSYKITPFDNMSVAVFPYR
ncbi:hypothetical protein L1987_67985 [Smallanthus sonchifolius]|uniref:Uncharacterized protein n=1 Tax=Smallanthus sonchifolius TaxID=185202 RepID=A0ACB9B4W4_9ASTR|nr:hypothetical protein L1987_67985 [Smallanthus sonchifolius]